MILADPSNVLPGMPAKHYKGLLDNHCASLAPLPLALPPPAGHIAIDAILDQGIGSVDVAIDSPLPVCDQEEAQEDEADGGQNAAVVQVAVAPVDFEELVGIGIAAPPIADADGLAFAGLGDDDADIGAADLPSEAGVEVVPPYRFPDTIEGRRVIADCFCGFKGNSTTRSMYNRLKVTCPNPLHKGCDFSMVINDTTTRRHGPREVVAWIGVWLRSARDYPDKASHKSNKPTAAKVDAYVAEFLS